MPIRQIALDTETTGIRHEEGHRIIEIGCVELINRKFTYQHFHFYLNPLREIDPGAFAVHGISNEFLADKPLFADIAGDFIQFITDAELIIHNATFDVGFLDNELALLKKQYKPITHYCSVIDTLPLARRLHPGQKNNLDALCKRYHIDNSKRDLHGALLDANLLAQVYLAMTGGQGSFFDNQDHQNIVNQATNHQPKGVTSALPPEASQLVILKASDEEQAAHKSYIDNMRAEGSCLWDEA